MRKILDREPTETMLAAANREWDGRMSARSAGVWQAMFDAAPPVAGGDGVRDRIAAIINREGGRPEGNIHSFRCTFPPGKPPCNCVEIIADCIVTEVLADHYLDALQDSVHIETGRTRVAAVTREPAAPAGQGETPETDEADDTTMRYSMRHLRVRDLACRLERERNEAQRALAQARKEPPSRIPLIKLLRDQRDECADALRGLMPEGWDDGTMDHMPGIAKARLVLEKIPTYSQQIDNICKWLGITRDYLMAALSSSRGKETS